MDDIFTPWVIVLIVACSAALLVLSFRVLFGKNEHEAKLAEIFENRKIRDGLKYLNTQTNYRFTSLFRFDRENLHNLYLFDRENPAIESSDDIPVTTSYCVYVRDSGNLFLVQDSSCDARVVGHPKRDVIKAYCGVPLKDRQGRLFGTICHFDVNPVSPQLGEVKLLKRAANILRPHLSDLAPPP